jgi:hypothetical protein
LKQIQLVYVVPKKRLKGLLTFTLDSIRELDRSGFEDARSTFPAEFESALAKIPDLETL